MKLWGGVGITWGEKLSLFFTEKKVLFQSYRIVVWVDKSSLDNMTIVDVS